MGKKCDFNREVAKNFSFTYLERLTPKHCNKPESCQPSQMLIRPLPQEENGGINEVGVFSDGG